MKKILAMIICFLLLAMPVYCESNQSDSTGEMSVQEITDFVSGLDDESLNYFYEAIQQELEKRSSYGEEAQMWYSNGLGSTIPDPVAIFGREPELDRDLFMNSNTLFMAFLRGCSKDEFYAYIDAVKECGYNAKIIEESSIWYEAKNEAGDKVLIVYSYPDISIQIDKKR